MIEKVKKYPLVKEYTKTSLPIKAIISFSIGFLIAPLSYSLLWFLLYLVGFEIILFSMNGGFDPYTRFVLIFSSIFGWVLGRLIVQLDPINEATNLFGF